MDLDGRPSAESTRSSTDMALSEITIRSFNDLKQKVGFGYLKQKYSQKYSKLLPKEGDSEFNRLEEQVSTRTAKTVQHLRRNVLIYILSTMVIFLSLTSTALFFTRSAAPSTDVKTSIPGAAIPDPTVDDPGHFEPHLDGVEIIEVGNCGNSSEEARAKGCIFDVMSILWVTPECYDAELAEEFKTHWDHEWWAHRKADPQDQVPYDVVAQGEWKYLWVEWEYHQLHCTFMWRKMHRAILNHWPMEDRLMSWGHTLHCEDMLVNWPEYKPRDINTRTILGYAKCLLPGKPKKELRWEDHENHIIRV